MFSFLARFLKVGFTFLLILFYQFLKSRVLYRGKKIQTPVKLKTLANNAQNIIILEVINIFIIKYNILYTISKMNNNKFSSKLKTNDVCQHFTTSGNLSILFKSISIYMAFINNQITKYEYFF